MEEFKLTLKKSRGRYNGRLAAYVSDFIQPSAKSYVTWVTIRTKRPLIRLYALNLSAGDLTDGVSLCFYLYLQHRNLSVHKMTQHYMHNILIGPAKCNA